MGRTAGSLRRPLKGAWVGLGEPASLPARAAGSRPGRRRDFAAVENRAGERRPLRELSGCFLALPAGAAPADRRHLPLRAHRRRHRRRRRGDAGRARRRSRRLSRRPARGRGGAPALAALARRLRAARARHRRASPAAAAARRPARRLPRRTRCRRATPIAPQLLDYCRRSANPIGRLLLHLYGVADARSLAQSDAICSALQLANFWQDLGVDASRGRLYVPAADALRHGVAERRAAGAPRQRPRPRPRRRARRLGARADADRRAAGARDPRPRRLGAAPGRAGRTAHARADRPARRRDLAQPAGARLARRAGDRLARARHARPARGPGRVRGPRPAPTARSVDGRLARAVRAGEGGRERLELLLRLPVPAARRGAPRSPPSMPSAARSTTSPTRSATPASRRPSSPGGEARSPPPSPASRAIRRCSRSCRTPPPTASSRRICWR